MPLITSRHNPGVGIITNFTEVCGTQRRRRPAGLAEIVRGGTRSLRVERHPRKKRYHLADETAVAKTNISNGSHPYGCEPSGASYPDTQLGADTVSGLDDDGPDAWLIGAAEFSPRWHGSACEGTGCYMASSRRTEGAIDRLLADHKTHSVRDGSKLREPVYYAIAIKQLR